MATSPWGQRVPIHIAWFLIWVAVIAGSSSLLFTPPICAISPNQESLRAPFRRRGGAHPRACSQTLADSAAISLDHGRLHVHTTIYRLPAESGVQFPWVTYHWIAGVVLTASILFHVIHASFFMDFWAIWPDRIDLRTHGEE